METIIWPSFISPLAAHDNFVDVIDNMVEKSNRLAFLYDEAKEIHLKDEHTALRRKATWRRSIISNGIEGFHPPAYRSLRKPLAEQFICGTSGVQAAVQVSHLCHISRAELPDTDVFALLKSLLLCNTSLFPGFDKADSCTRNVRDWVSIDFTNSWLGIYEAARNVKRLNQTYDWIMFVSCLAFRQNDRVSMDQLSVLNAVAKHTEQFIFINPPRYGGYSHTSQFEYDESQIEEILLSCVTTSFDAYIDSHKYKKNKTETINEFKKRMRPYYDNECQADLTALKNTIQRYWPSETIHSLTSNRPSTQYYDWSKAHDRVNDLFTRWFRNQKLRSFVLQVSKAVESICLMHAPDTNVSKLVSSLGDANELFRSSESSSSSPLRVRLDNFVSNNFDDSILQYCKRVFRGKSSNFDVETKPLTKVMENFPLKESNDSQICNEFIKDLRSSWNQWQLQKDTDAKDAPQSKKYRHRASAHIWNHITESIKNNANIYFASDWCQRLTPITLLPLICKTFKSGTPMSSLKKILGGYAITITHEQQQCRMVRFRKQGNELNLLEMKREARNIGHTNWSPLSHPEWLLFEIENDFLIRPLQIKVAQQMQCPDDGKNSLMQVGAFQSVLFASDQV